MADSITMDRIDTLAAEAFAGYVVRKDLARSSRASTPCRPTWASSSSAATAPRTDEQEIAEGLEIVQRQLQDRTVRAGEEELFKSRAREQGSVKLIDLVTARLDAEDRLLPRRPAQPAAQRRPHRATTSSREHERMLTGGFYAEVDLEYDAAIAEEKNGRPFGDRGAAADPDVDARRSRGHGARPARLHHRRSGRDFLLRSVGFEPEQLTDRAQDVAARCAWCRSSSATTTWSSSAPAAPASRTCSSRSRPTPTSSPAARRPSPRCSSTTPTASAAWSAQYDVVCFDEVSGVSFDQKDGVNIMKGYMESGEFSRGKESIRADGGIVMVGNFDVDVEHQQRIGHLFGPLPKEMRDDTAFMDRIHAYLPGWDVPKLEPRALHRPLRPRQRLPRRVLEPAARAVPAAASSRDACCFGGALSGRDITAVNKTVNGLLKLLYPDPEMTDRRRGPRVGGAHWRWRSAGASRSSRSASAAPSSATRTSATRSATTASSSSSRRPSCRAKTRSAPTRCRPARSGPSAPAGEDENAGLYPHRGQRGPGLAASASSTSPLRRPSRRACDTPSRTSTPCAKQLVGDRDPRPARVHGAAAGLRRSTKREASSACRCSSRCSALLAKSLRGGLVVVGGLNLGGGIEPVYNAVIVAELAVEKGAESLLMPDLGTPAAQRPLRRHGDEDQHPVLLRRAGSAPQGA